MNKLQMRDWVASLEEIIDNKLQKWRKTPKMENGECVQLQWSWDQTHMSIDIFWEDKKETVKLQYLSPRIDHAYQWHELNDRTFNKVMDRVGNLAQITMHRAITDDLPTRRDTD